MGQGGPEREARRGRARPKVTLRVSDGRDTQEVRTQPWAAGSRRKDGPVHTGAVCAPASLGGGGSVCVHTHAAPRLSPDFQLSSSTANCPLPTPP